MNTFEEVKEFVKQLKLLLIQRHKIELEHELYELESDLFEYGTNLLEHNYDEVRFLKDDLRFYQHIGKIERDQVRHNKFNRFNQIKRYFFTRYNELNEYIIDHSTHFYTDEYHKQSLKEQSERFDITLKLVHNIIDHRKVINELKVKFNDYEVNF